MGYQGFGDWCFETKRREGGWSGRSMWRGEGPTVVYTRWMAGGRTHFTHYYPLSATVSKYLEGFGWSELPQLIACGGVPG